MATQPIRPAIAPPAVPGVKPMAPPPVPPAAGKGPPLPPGVVAKGAPGVPKPAGAPPVPGQPGAGEEEEHRPHLGFWQQPWVQNILPVVTSVAVHATILILGLLIWGVVKVVQAKAQEIQVIIPDSVLAQNGPPGGIPNVGPTAGDINRQFMQDVNPEGSKDKFSDSDKNKLISAAGGNETAATGTTFDGGPGAMGGLGHGGGAGAEGGGGFAPPGLSGGGGIGPKGPVFGNGGNAHQIVYLCDGTGSMIPKITVLKDELSKSVSSLQPVQSFDILFFQDNKKPEFSTTLGAPELIQATPDNKRKAASFLDTITAEGQTNPLPALEAALKLHPQLLFILTDASDFPDPNGFLGLIDKYNADRKIKINTILFSEDKAEHERNLDSEPFLKGIADKNGGKFRAVEMDLLDQ